MARNNFLNVTALIKQRHSGQDEYGQFVYNYTDKSSAICSFQSLNGGEAIALGYPVNSLDIRAYFKKGTDIKVTDQLIINNAIYEVIWVNKLGANVGLTKGLQVDGRWVGYCENIYTENLILLEDRFIILTEEGFSLEQE